MDDKIRKRIQLDCLYDMFNDRIDENVVYIVYSENEGRIDATIDHLMSIASCSFTGHHFDLISPKLNQTNGALCQKKQVLDQESRKSAAKQAGRNVAGKSVSENSAIGGKTESITAEDKEIDYDDDDNDDDESNEELDVRIERLQKSIDDLLLEKKTTHDKASQYLSKKMYPVTSYYSELASQLRKMIEVKTQKLVELLLQKSKNSNCIDLHGLNPVQARLVVGELLNIRQDKLTIDKQGKASIDIITGWGKHSSTHGQRVRPTIVSYLREKGYEYQFLNRGALRVTIRR